MKKILQSLALLFLPLAYCAAQTDTLLQRIFLIGDAGELHGTSQPVIDWLKKNVDWNKDTNTVIYLGDNIYPYGMPPEGDPTYPQAKKIIDYQIGLVKGTKSRAYFIPGNHDWENGKLGGLQRVRYQVDYINGLQLPNVQAWPLDGCPGPVEVELNEKVVAVLMDSQWFLYLHDKPGPESNCSSKTIDEFQTELREIIASHPNQLVLLAMHHPMYSYGVHGGDYTWRHHIFPLTEMIPWLYVPLPVLGSVYPVARGVFGNVQDTKHPLYRGMARMIEEVVKEHPNVIVAAGHDHSLQLIRNKRDSIPYIVSGSGTNLSRVKGGSRAEFTDLHYGFTLIEVHKSGKVEIKFYNINSKDLNSPTYATTTKPIQTPSAAAVAAALDSATVLADSVLVAANPRLHGGSFRNFFMGKNYRPEWTTPVTVPVLNIRTEMGGLHPERQGGGKQTKSLRLKDSSGKEWVLRSIEKFPEAAIPADLRAGLARDIVEQGVSASYPFAPLSIAPLSQAAGVPTIRRKLVYVPDDPRLERFRKAFANTLAIMEEREPAHVKKTYNTDELVLRLAKDNDDHVDQKAMLKARLVDNFIMDFDRHEDQWRWATRDTGKGKIYYPIPRDHDQAFFVNQGLIPYFARKPWYVPELQGFQAKARNIKTFNRPARNLDRFFLNELSEQDWRAQVDTFLAEMTDPVIEQALQQQPRQVQPYHMNRIINTLKERRQHFRDDMLNYYRFISKEVTVVGTNQQEQFTITKNSDGSVQVVVHKIDKQGALSSKIYDRVFVPSVTKEVRIYGLSDDDRYIVEGGDSPIRIRLIGGPGKDEFINNGTGGKVLVYDASFEENKFSGNPGLRSKVSSDPQVNRYDRLSYKYNVLYPGLSVAYNIDDGVLLGAHVEYTEQGFRKDPYKMRQYFRGTRALRTSSYHFRYEGDFIKVIGNSDIILRGDMRAPINVTNFFGIGNETAIDPAKKENMEYYRARYNIANFSVMLRKQLQSWMQFNYGPVFQYFKVNEKENVGKFLNDAAVNGMDGERLYEPRYYAGAQAGLEINSRNNPVIPTRGLLLNAGARSLFGLNNYSSNLTQLYADLSIHMSLASKSRFVLATRFGAGHNIGKYEFPQAQYLSGVENLRGYRRERFAGRTLFFNNTELRVKLADFNMYLFPGSFGLQVFNDVGRVWADGDRSRDWHVGNGVGIWVSPVRRFVVTASLTRSKEEKALPLMTFGFQF